MYIQAINNIYPYSVDQLKADNPQTSFPKNLSSATFADFGVYPVKDTQQPEVDFVTQRVFELPPIEVNGEWFQAWEIQPLSAEEIEANSKVPVPTQVTMRQACIQLELDGLLDDVEAIVATLPRVYQIEWQRAATVFRDNLLVEMVRQQKGMTEQQIDELFVKALKR